MREMVFEFLTLTYKDNPITKVQYETKDKSVIIYQDSNIELVCEVHDFGNDKIMSYSSINLAIKINSYFILDDREIDLYIREWCQNNYSKLRLV